MIELNNKAEWDEQIAKQELTVAKFYTAWCPDCHRIDPFMPELEKQFKDQISFVSLDRDRFPELSQQLDIFGIPSFIAFKNGQELIRFVSKLGKSREEIEHFLQRAVQVASTLDE
ncbi:thiol reductase thioredoxin [Ammoniphilus oxalaticus]|uniref:Thiol reductase thioredoxin n=1 Tax=Ammoniphilus oxalaticus TaxID=66863 RepID=A0A419SQN5_9BACL|nr:thioredoxin family protein [Ammoniphilus oxalaticus]RKD26786.1 thiol reductase thioredoxin [Ammoniphilus oxalaticus]